MKRNFRAHYLRERRAIFHSHLLGNSSSFVCAFAICSIQFKRLHRNIKKVQRDIKNDDIDIDVFEGAIHLHKLEDKTLLNSVMYSPKSSRK